MKFRIGFVSNSSSSSFIIKKAFLSPDQIAKIHDHIHFAKEVGMDMTWVSAYDEWRIRETNECITGDVTMDNFCMSDFLAKIGVPSEHIVMDSD